MKRIACLAIVGVMLSGVIYASPEEDVKKVVTEFTSAFANLDKEKALVLVSPDGVLKNLNNEKTRVYFSEKIDRYKKWGKTSVKLKLTVKDIIVNENSATVESSWAVSENPKDVVWTLTKNNEKWLIVGFSCPTVEKSNAEIAMATQVGKLSFDAIEKEDAVLFVKALAPFVGAVYDGTLDAQTSMREMVRLGYGEFSPLFTGEYVFKKQQPSWMVTTSKNKNGIRRAVLHLHVAYTKPGDEKVYALDKQFGPIDDEVAGNVMPAGIPSAVSTNTGQGN